MKTDKKQIERAGNDIAERVLKLLTEIKPAIGAKYQLTGQALDVAFTRGVGTVVIGLAKVADMLTDDLLDPPSQTSIDAATAHV